MPLGAIKIKIKIQCADFRNRQNKVLFVAPNTVRKTLSSA